MEISRRSVDCHVPRGDIPRPLLSYPCKKVTATVRQRKEPINRDREKIEEKIFIPPVTVPKYRRYQ